jgi:hypothetical protein
MKRRAAGRAGEARSGEVMMMAVRGDALWRIDPCGIDKRQSPDVLVCENQ